MNALGIHLLDSRFDRGVACGFPAARADRGVWHGVWLGTGTVAGLGLGCRFAAPGLGCGAACFIWSASPSVSTLSKVKRWTFFSGVGACSSAFLFQPPLAVVDKRDDCCCKEANGTRISEQKEGNSVLLFVRVQACLCLSVDVQSKRGGGGGEGSSYFLRSIMLAFVFVFSFWKLQANHGEKCQSFRGKLAYVTIERVSTKECSWCNEEEIFINLITNELVVEKKCPVIKLVEHLRAWRLVFACDQGSFLILAATKPETRLPRHVHIFSATAVPTSISAHTRTNTRTLFKQYTQKLPSRVFQMSLSKVQIQPCSCWKGLTQLQRTLSISAMTQNWLVGFNEKESARRLESTTRDTSNNRLFVPNVSHALRFGLDKFGLRGV